jgi:hypothetical protein
MLCSIRRLDRASPGTIVEEYKRWVPARAHPELASKEFKTIIEEKVHSIHFVWQG